MDQFDQLAQEIFKQKQRMDQLEAENRELHRQLAELRAGRGIYVDISGRRFSLRDGSSPREHFIGTR
jgi:cell division protein FtsB